MLESVAGRVHMCLQLACVVSWREGHVPGTWNGTPPLYQGKQIMTNYFDNYRRIVLLGGGKHAYSFFFFISPLVLSIYREVRRLLWTLHRQDSLSFFKSGREPPSVTSLRYFLLISSKIFQSPSHQVPRDSERFSLVWVGVIGSPAVLGREGCLP